MQSHIEAVRCIITAYVHVKYSEEIASILRSQHVNFYTTGLRISTISPPHRNPSVLVPHSITPYTMRVGPSHTVRRLGCFVPRKRHSPTRCRSLSQQTWRKDANFVSPLPHIIAAGRLRGLLLLPC